MASQLGQGQLLEQQAQAQQLAAKGGDLAPVLQQLNMTSLRTRTQDLHTAIGRILHSFLTNPSLKWSEVLGQFAMVNVELLNLVDDIKPILKMYVVYPKNVNADNAPVLPIMLSSKLLPEMETEEAAMKEQILGGMSNLSVPLQTEKLQRQIEAVRSACDVAEKVITEARKVYGLGTRQGPVALPTMDKVQATRLAEQERMLRAATNFGEGLRTSAEQQQQQPGILPPHLVAAFATTRDGRATSYPGADGGYLKASASVLPPSGLRPSTQQQQATQMASRVQTPTQSIGAGAVGGLAGSSPQQLPYMVNSPRSGNFNVSSPQQSQSQQQSQAAFLQRTKAQQQQQQLQRQHQQHQQLQAQLQQQAQQHQQQQQQQQQQQLQQQQLRHPSTPPIQQAQVGSQLQGQVAQPLLQQQKQQLQQQNQNRLTQQLAHHQQQQLMQQQALQLQERHAMQAAQNTLQQGSQGRPQMGGQQGSLMSNLYNSGTASLLTSNVMGAMSQPVQSQTLLQQRMQQFQQGNQLSAANQPQQNASSMLSDTWGTGNETQLPQNSSNLGLPLQQQQQQLPQTNYMSMFNNQSQANFGQNRQQPPPS